MPTSSLNVHHISGTITTELKRSRVLSPLETSPTSMFPRSEGFENWPLDSEIWLPARGIIGLFVLPFWNQPTRKQQKNCP